MSFNTGQSAADAATSPGKQLHKQVETAGVTGATQVVNYTQELKTCKTVTAQVVLIWQNSLSFS